MGGRGIKVLRGGGGKNIGVKTGVKKTCFSLNIKYVIFSYK